MSQENVEIVRGICEAFLAGDVDRALRGLGKVFQQLKPTA